MHVLYLSFSFLSLCTLAPFSSDGFFLFRPVSGSIEPWTSVRFCHCRCPCYMDRVECRARSIFTSSPDKVQTSSQADLPSSAAASVLQHHSTCCFHRPKRCGEPSQIRPGPNLVLCNAHELRQT